MEEQKQDTIRRAVRESYASVATTGEARHLKPSEESCCGGTTADKAALVLGYGEEEVRAVPEGANMGLGCGNPMAIASLQPGETVLDLGSGGGFDCFLAAAQVGPEGRVIGVDMTPEMISKARANAEKGGYGNVEFRLGEIEHLPVSDGSLDAIISNCVINLSPDKPAVYQEAFRALKPGGRLAVSDIVASAPLPEEMRNDLDLRSRCVGGAETVPRLQAILEEAGFGDIRIRPKDESRSFIRKWLPGGNLDDFILSATIEARKPV